MNPRDRIQSDGAADDKKKKNSDMKKSCSLSNHAADRQQNESSGKKKVKDLNDFYRMANKKTEETPDVKESVEDVEDDDEGFLLVGNCLSARLDRLPPPTVFGDGNPFLMFMCLACLLQHRDHIMNQQLDYQVTSVILPCIFADPCITRLYIVSKPLGDCNAFRPHGKEARRPQHLGRGQEDVCRVS